MPQATNIVLLYDNQVLMDGVAITASSEASASLAAANLADPNPNKRWRSLGETTAAWLLVDFASIVPFRFVAVPNHNWPLDSTWRLRTTATAIDDWQTDTGSLDVWRGAYGFGDPPFGLDPFGGYPESELRPYIAAIADLGYVEARYLRIDITAPSNSDPYLTAGLIFADVGLQPERNLAFGWSVGWAQASQEIATDGGGARVLRRTPWRVLDLTLPALTRGEALGQADSLAQRIAHGRHILVSPFLASGEPRPEVYGLAQITQPLTQRFYNVFSLGLRVRSV